MWTQELRFELVLYLARFDTCSTPAIIPGVKVFGLKGAALAARGDKPDVFGVLCEPFAGRTAGVKLGESTLNLFFALWKSSVSIHGKCNPSVYIHLLRLLI